MSWVKKGFPLIEGYESLGNVVEAKQWLNFILSRLLDAENPVPEYRKLLKTRQAICDFVITQIDYPFYRGVPTDRHYINWFNGQCCCGLTQDYWQKASETLLTLKLNQRKGKKGRGDCEDTSILHTTLFLEKKWEAFECLGIVLEDGEVLGGHGWSIFKDENGVWRLYESTLDTPPQYPDGYPIINPSDTYWKIGNIIYRGYVKFNRREYYEIEGVNNMLEVLLSASLRLKDTKRKYKAIARAWGQQVKPLKKVSVLSRLRKW